MADSASNDAGARLREIALTGRDDMPSLAFRAACLVVADLVDQGWAYQVANGEIWMQPPPWRPRPTEASSDAKSRLKAHLTASRDQQLAEPGTRDFLDAMMRRRVHNGNRVSVLDLVDDGASLARALAAAHDEHGLAAVVDPRLFLCDDAALCPFTGLLLRDVWRFFRHTWSLDYRPTPGRSLAFLVRNVARPRHPVMGIALITNAALKLGPRDRWLGWTIEAIERDLDHGVAPPALARSLILALRDAIGAIRCDDLIPGASVCPDGTDGHDPVALAAHLRQRAEIAHQTHEERLRARESQRVSGARSEPSDTRALPMDQGQVDWQAASERPLFVYKRATTLAALLEARAVFVAAGADVGTSNERVRIMLRDPAGRRAVTVALTEVRKRGLASHMMDLSVCGAVPPYNAILGGKLVATAMLSREVQEAYARRYKDSASQIASQLAGRAVIRSPELYVLTTTSLYGLGSSQYNRLSYRAHEHPGLDRDVAWVELGLSEGYGTVHFSRAAVAALRELCRVARRARRVNYEFGEGSSPRLRQIREGLDVLGLRGSDLLRHASPRLVYGAELVEDARSRLRGCSDADADASAPPPLSVLAAAWRQRWLHRRVGRPSVLLQVQSEGPDSVESMLAPRHVDRLSPSQAPGPVPPRADARTALANGEVDDMATVSADAGEFLEAIRHLYKSRATIADRHSPGVLAFLNVKTPVEEYLLGALCEGAIIFLTGNPGDGKTHLVRQMEPHLPKTVQVVLDANTMAQEDLARRVEEVAAATSSALIVCINHGVLMELVTTYESRAWAAEVYRQITSPLVSAGGETPQPRVQVVDLSLRNNLGRATALELLNRLTDPRLYAGLPDDDPHAANAAALRQERVAERLVTLLHTVGQRGHHATMRDVLALLSYAIFGGRSESELRELARDGGPTYADLLFEGGQGDLFEAIRSFDPVSITHPLLDDLLWRGADEPEEWSGNSRPPQVPAGNEFADRWQSFVSRKRRAYFEHVQGGAILEQRASTDEEFDETLQRAEASDARPVIGAINRYYDCDEQTNDRLYLWVTHTYHALPSRFAACSRSVPAEHLAIRVPRPPAYLTRAFPDFVPDHFLLVHRDDPTISLRVDRTFLRALRSAGRGLPPSLRPGEPGLRLGTFLDRLAKLAGSPAGPERVRLVDVHSGENMEILVDTRSRSYVRL